MERDPRKFPKAEQLRERRPGELRGEAGRGGVRDRNLPERCSRGSEGGGEGEAASIDRGSMERADMHDLGSMVAAYTRVFRRGFI